MELINALGISWPTVISQLINFALLYFILKKFALEGLLEFITKRQKQIVDGLNNAKKADESLAQAQAQQEEILASARRVASDIIATARTQGQNQEQQIVAAAKQQALKIVADGEKQVAVTKGKMMLEAKSELAAIIATGVRRIVDEKVDPATITADYLQEGVKA